MTAIWEDRKPWYDDEPNGTRAAAMPTGQFTEQIGRWAGRCELCGEPVGDDEQAEVVEVATGARFYAHAEGCHDATYTDDGTPRNFKHA